jgi:hypothetical protein
MRLDELFTHPAKIKWVSDNHGMIGRTMIGDYNYRFDFEKIERGMWDFYFMVDDPKFTKNTMSNTGTGKEFTVFATAIDALQSFIKIEKPNAIFFTGDITLGKARLYDIIIEKLRPELERHDYKVVRHDAETKVNYHIVKSGFDIAGMTARN